MAEVATSATSDHLLVVIDPVARRADPESVRIAKDVLSAGAATKVCLPEGPEEFARVLARRGSRRPVVVGDDRALMRAVSLLHRQRELAGCALSMVPVGRAVPGGGAGRPHGGGGGGARRARRGRTADGSPGRRQRRGGARRLADSVLPLREAPPADQDDAVTGASSFGSGSGSGSAHASWLRTCQSLVRTLVPVRPSREPLAGVTRLGRRGCGSRWTG